MQRWSEDHRAFAVIMQRWSEDHRAFAVIMQRWSEDHRAFAVETVFKNNDSSTVTRRVFF